MSSTVAQTSSLQTTGFSIDEVTYTRQAPNAMFNPSHTAMPVHMVSPVRTTRRNCVTEAGNFETRTTTG